MNNDLNKLADCLQDLSKIIRDLNKTNNKDLLKEFSIFKQEVTEKEEEITKHDLKSYLNKLGFKPHLAGYQYIISAIEWLKTNNKEAEITKILYPAIADKHNTTWNKVERAIRHSIEVSFLHNENVYVKLFGIHEKPTNKEFIYRLLGLLED